MSDVNRLMIDATGAQTAPRFDRRRLNADAGIWCAAVLLTVYLALSGGGYDIVVRSEVGLIIWWAVLLGIIVGLLPRARIRRAGFIAVALLAGFLLWSWLGLAWSSSHELTLDSVCQLSTYLATLVIGLCLVTRDNARPLVCGLAAGIAIVSGLAVLSKLIPGSFPRDTAAGFYATARLSYPFDYPDGVGEFAALGIPLLLFAANEARTLLARAAAGAGLPLVLLCLAMTVSRGGILAAVIGLAVFIGLIPNRLPRLSTLLIAGAGIAVLMVALLHRAALRDQLGVAPASERHSMLTLVIVVVVLSAVAHVALGLLSQRFDRPVWTRVSSRAASRTGIAIAVLVAAVVVVALASGAVSHMWHDFKQVNPSAQSNQYFRLLSLAGSHRYQYWQVAVKAFDSSPFHGIGPGTFRFYWAQHQTIGEYIQNAHSLWFETLAEAGIVGLVLIAGFFLFVIIGGGIRAARTQDPYARALLATAVAGVAAFCGAAAFDWVWQIGVVPVVAMLLVAVAVSSLDAPKSAANGPQTGLRVRTRLVLSLGVLVAIALIAVPLASTIAVRKSQNAVQKGRPSGRARRCQQRDQTRAWSRQRAPSTGARARADGRREASGQRDCGRDHERASELGAMAHGGATRGRERPPE